ncbi:L,D-transpeptidase family protein [Cetobacterium somerae]|uniref:L,D-transpeptidase family protein n=1 Tax=Cetobacterium sp. NK01 TaxID=2993530 RepID=UPI002116043E|nr:L,D-transpeptidase family protein [Cetobacterium sp. NK01]MCQ8211545.1 L,D-transpeptidase family protein [Cetobacterium sp. NK01]
MKKSKLISLGIMVFGLTFLSQPLHAVTKKLKEKYENVIPMSVHVNIMNNEAEPEYLNYVFIKSVDAPIREDSSIYSKEIVRFPFNTKLKVIEKVESNGNEWYKVELKDRNGNKVQGYISAMLVTLRRFRFEEMNNKVHKLTQFLQSESAKGKELVSINTYVPNPSNQNMSRIKDKYGVSADQNARANYNGETIFIPDRSLMSVESTKGNDVYVNALSIAEKPLKVSKNVITRYPAVNANFRKAIVIDLENENQGIFQKNSEGQWELISYTLNKTGMESTLGFDTPRGYFIVPVLKYEMGYRDEYNNAAGMAKYAIRFSGGGYIHGTPINFEENINRDFFLREKDGTLGTVEGTRKCIRNMESHIKFLFDWVTNGKVNRKSNEQRPDENVMVIVF